MSQELVLKERRENLFKALDTYRPKLIESLPAQHRNDGGNRWLRALINCVGRNPKLIECSPASVISSALLAAELGFDLNPISGQCALIPYNLWDKGLQRKVMTCTLQAQYQGLIDLAYRTGRVGLIYAHEVFSNDVFRLSYGTDKRITHEPAVVHRGSIIGYYAVAKLENGEHVFEWMTTEEIEAHRDQYSKGYIQDMEYSKKNNRECTNPWHTNFPAMAKKTVVKKLMPWLPKSPEDMTLERAVAIDTSSEQGIPLKDMGVDLPIDIPGESEDAPADSLNAATAALEAQTAQRATTTAQKPAPAAAAATEAPAPAPEPSMEEPPSYAPEEPLSREAYDEEDEVPFDVPGTVSDPVDLADIIADIQAFVRARNILTPGYVAAMKRAGLGTMKMVDMTHDQLMALKAELEKEAK